MTIFEDFIEYCKEDNYNLAKDIKIWLADYFDLPNRTIKLSKDEEEWIEENLSVQNQKDILGYSLLEYEDDGDELKKIVKDKMKNIKNIIEKGVKTKDGIKN